MDGGTWRIAPAPLKIEVKVLLAGEPEPRVPALVRQQRHLVGEQRPPLDELFFRPNALQGADPPIWLSQVKRAARDSR